MRPKSEIICPIEWGTLIFCKGCCKAKINHVCQFFKLKYLYILKARLFYICFVINKFLNLVRVLRILENTATPINAPHLPYLVLPFVIDYNYFWR